MITVQTNQGRQEIKPNGATLLDMLENEQIPVVAQCRQGFCGACRTRVTKGEVEYIADPLGFTRQGEVLACVCRPKSNLEIDVRIVA